MGVNPIANIFLRSDAMTYLFLYSLIDGTIVYTFIGFFSQK